MLAALRELGEAHLAEAQAEAEAAGVRGARRARQRPSEHRRWSSSPSSVDAQMIVVGSYGEKPLKGALIGSTAHKLLHLSERPVLVVRAAA